MVMDDDDDDDDDDDAVASPRAGQAFAGRNLPRCGRKLAIIHHQTLVGEKFLATSAVNQRSR